MPNQLAYLLAAAPLTFESLNESDSDNPKQRTFSGIANSGKPFSYFSHPTIVDLAEISYKDKVPVLDLHDRSKRCGVASFSVTDNQLLVSGHLLSNDFASSIAADADEGFPWELSAHVEPGSVETLEAGQTATVNGQTVTGPIEILRHNTVREVSFTPTGIDQQTTAVVMSDDGKTREHIQPKTTEQSPMTLEEALEKIKALEAENTRLETENQALKETANKATIDAKLSAAGFVLSDDTKTYEGVSSATYSLLLSADSEQVSAIIADLSPKAMPEIPVTLLSETTAGNAQASGVNLSASNPLLADAASRCDH